MATGFSYSLKRLTFGSYGSVRFNIESFLQDRPPPTDQVIEEDAEISWGLASEFEYDTSQGDYRKGFDIIVTTRGDEREDDDDDDDEEEEELPPESVVFDFIEISRQTETVRVSNPNDSAQYVDIERIKTVTFRGPNAGAHGELETQWRFTMNWGEGD